MCWPAQFEFYARLKRELREAVFTADASPECKRAVWETVSRVLERYAAELEERAASRAH